MNEDNEDIKYLNIYLITIKFAICFSLIYLLYNYFNRSNLKKSADKTYGVTNLYLSLYYNIIFGFILIIIINMLIKQQNSNINHNTPLKDIIKFETIYIVTEVIPILSWIVSIISLIILNYRYTIKINSNNLTDIFYIYNIIYLGIILIQFITYSYSYYKNENTNNIQNIIRKIINIVLMILNIGFTVAIWDQPLYFTTDG